jgi:alcohol dehydrogenase
MRFNREPAAAHLALVAHAMGVKTAGMEPLAAAEAAVVAVQDLQRRLGLPRTLGEAGLDRALLPRLAIGAMSDRGLYFNPRPATEEEVLALLQEAW